MLGMPILIVYTCGLCIYVRVVSQTLNLFFVYRGFEGIHAKSKQDLLILDTQSCS